jgi:hypothetical protein
MQRINHVQGRLEDENSMCEDDTPRCYSTAS